MDLVQLRSSDLLLVMAVALAALAYPGVLVLGNSDKDPVDELVGLGIAVAGLVALVGARRAGGIAWLLSWVGRPDRR